MSGSSSLEPSLADAPPDCSGRVKVLLHWGTRSQGKEVDI